MKEGEVAAESSVLRKKEEGELEQLDSEVTVKRMTGSVHRQLENKRDHVCNKGGWGLYVFSP